MGITFDHTPEIFGFIHLAILAGIIVLSFLFYALMKNRKQQTLITILGILGLIMVIGEVWKQWFVPRYVYTDGPSAWFFPWQLCSMSMYVGFLLFFARGRFRDALLVFLSSYNIVAALGALIFPYDMMRPQIPLFVHSFLYHGLMLVQSLGAVLILKKAGRKPFLPACILFCIMAAMAEVINVISHHLIHDFSLEANMFNITPYYPSTQPVFHDIAVKLGILPEILIYLGFITLLSWGLYRLLMLKKKPISVSSTPQ
jgi:hypothetical protein